MSSILGKRPRTHSLLDVFSITYLGRDEVKPENQLGTIKLYTNRGLQYLYRVEEVDIRKPSIKYGDAIPLMVKGPTPTTCGDFVCMEFDLFCGAYYGMIRLPWEPGLDEVSRKRVLFNSKDGTGRILVHMGRFANATIANVKVKLLSNLRNFAGPVVSGAVFATNSKLDLADCTSVLFLKERDDKLLVGYDDVMPLSKSFVGVPLNSKLSLEVSLNVFGEVYTAIVGFDALEKGVNEASIPNDERARICVEVTWGVDIDDARIYDTCYINSRKITMYSADQKDFVVDEVVALEFHSLKDKIKRSSSKNPTFHLPGITKNILAGVICYCNNRVHRSLKRVICYCNNRIHRSFWIDFDGEFVGQYHLTALFNLIQAAHHFQIKSLMDLTCRTLGYKVKTQISENTNIFYEDDASLPRLVRTYSEEAIPSIDSILRQPGKETLIDEAFLVNVAFSSLATKRLSFFEKENPISRCLSNFVASVDSETRDLVKLLEATTWLYNLIDGDTGLALYLSSDDVKRLLQILEEIDNKDSEDINVDIQCLAVLILSHVLSLPRFYEYSLGAAPALVKLLFNPLLDINIVGVFALTRLAFAFQTCKEVILEKGALERALEIVIHNRYDSELIQEVARFLAVVCCRVLPDDKVNVALAMSEDFLVRHTGRDLHVVSTCYALQYLTYGRHIKIEGEAWNKLIKGLVGHISNNFTNDYTTDACPAPIKSENLLIAGSALGVVGNIARWGHPNQIQSLANDSLLLRCLGKMLCFEHKKFSKEACQIISNIAARNQTSIQDMDKAKLVEPLCRLLEEDMYESDVKLEAAWAIYNGICGNNFRQIDYYPESLWC